MIEARVSSFQTFFLILFAIPALIALGFYRAGGSLDWRFRWKTRQEAPKYFWFTIIVWLCFSLLIPLFFMVLIGALAYRGIAT
jgi:hypothetical protein